MFPTWLRPRVSVELGLVVTNPQVCLFPQKPYLPLASSYVTMGTTELGVNWPCGPQGLGPVDICMRLQLLGFLCLPAAPGGRTLQQRVGQSESRYRLCGYWSTDQVQEVLTPRSDQAHRLDRGDPASLQAHEIPLTPTHRSMHDQTSSPKTLHTHMWTLYFCNGS